MNMHTLLASRRNVVASTRRDATRHARCERGLNVWFRASDVSWLEQQWQWVCAVSNVFTSWTDCMRCTELSWRSGGVAWLVSSTCSTSVLLHYVCSCRHGTLTDRWACITACVAAFSITLSARFRGSTACFNWTRGSWNTVSCEYRG